MRVLNVLAVQPMRVNVLAVVRYATELCDFAEVQNARGQLAKTRLLREQFRGTLACWAYEDGQFKSSSENEGPAHDEIQQSKLQDVFQELLRGPAATSLVSPDTFAHALAVLMIAQSVLFELGALDGSFQCAEQSRIGEWSALLAKLREVVNNSQSLRRSGLVSQSALLLELSKLELLVLSLPCANEKAKVISAGKKILKGVFKFSTSGIQDVVGGLFDAATVGIKRAQRRHAKHLVDKLALLPLMVHVVQSEQLKPTETTLEKEKDPKRLYDSALRPISIAPGNIVGIALGCAPSRRSVENTVQAR